MRRYALRDDQWDPIKDILPGRDHDNEYMMIDATIVRAHQHSGRRSKKIRGASHRPPAAD